MIYRKRNIHKFRLRVEVDDEVVEAGSVKLETIDRVRTCKTSLKLGDSFGTEGVIRTSPSIEAS